MQLDVDIEPTLRFPGMTSIEKEMDLSESKLSIYLICISTTDRQKAMHKSPLCNLHRWAKKEPAIFRMFAYEEMYNLMCKICHIWSIAH